MQSFVISSSRPERDGGDSSPKRPQSVCRFPKPAVQSAPPVFLAWLCGNEERMVLIVRLDNLGKGASGPAVKAMNVHLAIEENLGLV